MTLRVLDGEGWGGNLRLLAGSDGRELLNPDGLSSDHCLDWLVRLPSGPNYFWHFDWDTNHIVADLDLPALRALAHDGKCEWQGYRIAWIPGHMLRVQRERGEFFGVDLGTWGGSLEDECRRWDIAVPSIVSQGKDARDRLCEWPFEKVKAYNTYELEAADELAVRITSALTGFGLSGISPGQCAARLLKKWGAEQWMAEAPPHAEDAWSAGWIEANAWGRWDGPVFAYDLSGAYAWALSQLPDLTRLSWAREDSWPVGPFDLVRVRWEAEDHPLPRWNPWWTRRADGSLARPDEGEGWFWGCEVKAHTQHRHLRWEVLECWRCTEIPTLLDGPSRPFAAPIASLYRERQAFADSPASDILKKTINAIWGQMARSGEGGARYASRSWAGITTALIRARVSSLLAEYGQHIVAVNTDGVLAVTPLPIEKTGLGEWRLQQHSLGPMHLLGPGLASAPTNKTRGHRLREMPAIPQVVEMLWAEGPFAEVTYPKREFVGLHDALNHDRMDLWRQWVGDDQVVRVVDRSETPISPFAGRVRSPRGGQTRSALFESRIEGEWEWLAPLPVAEASLPD